MNDTEAYNALVSEGWALWQSPTSSADARADYLKRVDRYLDGGFDAAGDLTLIRTRVQNYGYGDSGLEWWAWNSREAELKARASVGSAADAVKETAATAGRVWPWLLGLGVLALVLRR